MERRIGQFGVGCGLAIMTAVAGVFFPLVLGATPAQLFARMTGDVENLLWTAAWLGLILVWVVLALWGLFGPMGTDGEGSAKRPPGDQEDG